MTLYILRSVSHLPSGMAAAYVKGFQHMLWYKCAAFYVQTRPFCRYHSLDQDVGSLELTDVLPPPVAADLNGDGRVEVITATHNARLHVGSYLLTRAFALRPTVLCLDARHDASMSPG